MRPTPAGSPVARCTCAWGGLWWRQAWWGSAGDRYMVIDRKQETFFVLLEKTPPERQRIQRTLKLLVHETMAN